MGRGREGRNDEPVIEVIVDVDDHGRRPAPGPSWDRDGALVAAVLAGVVVVAGLVWALADRGDPAPPDDALPTTTAPGAAVPTPDPTPGDLTVATATGDDGLVVVSARTDAATAPWVTFEICAVAPPGCAPVWTTELDQDGATFTATLRIPDRFVAPGGFDHDCVPVGCELRVTTTTGSVAFAIDRGRPLLREVTAEGVTLATTTLDPVPPEGLGVTVEPVEGGVRVVVEGAPAGQAVTVGACPADALRCPVLGRRLHRAVDEQRGDPVDVTVRVPSVMSAWVVTADGGAAWVDTDCDVADCVVEVGVIEIGVGGEAVARLPLPGGRPTPADPTLRVEPGPVAPGGFIGVGGTGFAPHGDGPGGRAAWLLCEVRPGSFAEVPAHCGTPRLAQPPVLGADGGFDTTVPAPDPATVRTWVGNRPLECRAECWLVVLAEPFPRLAAAPIAYTAR